MTFASITFIVFFTLVLVLEGITNVRVVKEKLGNHFYIVRHMILLIASYIFYGWWDWRFCFLILFVTVTAYLAGLLHQNKTVVVMAVCVVLVVLGIFKYYNFFVESFCELFSISSAGTINIILPVGISFYTFQAISYIADVRLGRLQAERSFVNVALYIAFFSTAGSRSDCKGIGVSSTAVGGQKRFDSEFGNGTPDFHVWFIQENCTG